MAVMCPKHFLIVTILVPTAQERWKKAVWKVSVAHGFSIPVIGDDISGSGTLDEDVMEELQKKDMVNCILFIFGEVGRISTHFNVSAKMSH